MIARLLPLVLLLAGAVQAQPPADPFARMRLDSAGDPADRLAGYLRTLAVSPRDVPALVGAGRAALDVGDANAAIGFFARADGLSPRSAPIKVGLATALLRMGKARDALRLFGDAVELGVAEREIAAERGLAWDLRGEPRKAQRDYLLALTAGPDDETTRRLALSYAIAGDRLGAVAALTPLTQRNDAAAWRAKAFALALTGDLPQAEGIATTVMPGGGEAMRPFLARLAGLNTTEKARAVHLGEMPSDGTRYSETELARLGGGGATRPGYRPETASPPAVAATTLPASPTTAWLRNRTRLLGQFSPRASAQRLKADETVTRPTADATPLERGPAPIAGPRTVPDAEPLPKLALASPAKARTSRPAATAKNDDERAAKKDRAAKGRAAKDDTEETSDGKGKGGRPAKGKSGKAETRAEKAAKANPERIWVQVAGGANADDLPKAWTRVKAKAPALLKGKTASTTKVRATNRLLVGPFKTEDEAQSLVNKLGGTGLSGFIVTTDKGQKVEKLGGRTG